MFWPKRYYIPILSQLLMVGVGVLITHVYYQYQIRTEVTWTVLRQQGYELISPLLACNLDLPDNVSTYRHLKTKLQSLVDNQTTNPTTISIYFRDLTQNNSFSINPDEKYYPASLNKIPMMITAFKMAQPTNEFLQTTLVATQAAMRNHEQEIMPQDFLVPGDTYTVTQALEAMILYSDNNAFYSLAHILDPMIYQTAFRDLNIPLRTRSEEAPDYLTAENFSYFLRVLYNASYLNRANSQAALKLLTRVTYDRALAAGLPPHVQIAHKFGTFTDQTQSPSSRELHDCGIIYHPTTPYLLCVMTKSQAKLAEVEQFISTISRVVYEAIE